MDAAVTSQPHAPDASAAQTGRVLQPEIMDDPTLDPPRHRAALRGLGRINAISRSAAILWPTLRVEADRVHPRPLRVLDLACGGGDVLVTLARKAKAHGRRFEATGLDFSPVALDFARTLAEQRGVEIEWTESNALEQPLPGDFDVAMNSLFLHHLTAEQSVDLLTKMRQAARTVVINDLRRGALAHAVAWVGTRLLSRSEVVHADGPQSVRAAWTPPELRQLAESAGLHGAKIEQVFPWRMRLVWRGQGEGTAT
jgi:2-polyprenyl-3-methyl-5-hydroxy-6-metoxy-1,4-benzoquinol methylase